MSILPALPSISNLGIPPLLNKIDNVIAGSQLLTADLTLLFGFGNAIPPIWGIYLNNNPVIVPDSVLSLDYKKEYNLADYPMENGAFQTYNKVATPYDVKITMTKGGTIADRETFLQKAEDIVASLDLYDVVTPEHKYLNANIARYDYRRTSTNGVTLLTVDFWLSEIRVTVPSIFTNTTQPSSQATSTTGNVQPSANQTAPVTQ